MGYHHQPLVQRLVQKEGWSEEEAGSVFADMKRFLFLCGTTKGPFAPTNKIDAAWHHFILFTRDYMSFCEKFFGRYIHHQPRIEGDPPDREIVPRTLAAAREIFGELSEHWDFRARLTCTPECKACNDGPGVCATLRAADCGFSDCKQCNDTNCQDVRPGN
jgi:hypothetical protein